MQEFKKIIKMKTGGSVAKAVAAAEKKEERAEAGMHEDVKQDKKLIKKAINLHDDQLHEGKKTDLKTLKKGGRCKREGGTVTKYKCGGEVKPKKMAIGGLTDPTTQALVNSDVLRRRRAAQAAQGAGGLGAPGMAPGVNPAVPPATGVPAASPVGAPVMPNPGVQAPGAVMKKGGKVKKGCK